MYGGCKIPSTATELERALSPNAPVFSAQRDLPRSPVRSCVTHVPLRTEFDQQPALQSGYLRDVDCVRRAEHFKLGVGADASSPADVDEFRQGAVFVGQHICPVQAWHPRVGQDVGIALPHLVRWERPMVLIRRPTWRTNERARSASERESQGVRAHDGRVQSITGIVIVAPRDGSRRPKPGDARRPSLIIHEPPILALFHCLLQNPLEREVVRGAHASRGIDPINDPLSMGVLISLHQPRRLVVVQRTPAFSDDKVADQCAVDVSDFQRLFDVVLRHRAAITKSKVQPKPSKPEGPHPREPVYLSSERAERVARVRASERTVTASRSHHEPNPPPQSHSNDQCRSRPRSPSHCPRCRDRGTLARLLW